MIISKNTDFNLVGGIEGIKQAIYVRLKTELLGCKLWPNMGHDLRQMFGKRITKKNCEKVKQLLVKALTFGDVFDIIGVEVIPIEGSTMYVHCILKFINGITYSFNFEYNFEDSLLSDLEFNIIVL